MKDEGIQVLAFQAPQGKEPPEKAQNPTSRCARNGVHFFMGSTLTRRLESHGKTIRFRKDVHRRQILKNRDFLSLSPDHVNKFGTQAVTICTQCGETYFEEKEVNSIQKIIQAVDTQTEQLQATG